MKPKRPLRFEYGKHDNGQFYWHLKSPNGEIICQGEGYQRGAGVLKVYRAIFQAKIPPTIIYLNKDDKRKPRFLKPKREKKVLRNNSSLNRPWP